MLSGRRIGSIAVRYRWRLRRRLVRLNRLLRRGLLARPRARLRRGRRRLRGRLIRLLRRLRLRRRRRRWRWRLGSRHDRSLRLHHRGGGKLDVGLGRLGRDVDLVLSDLASPIRGHLVAGGLVRYHLRERLGLRRVRLLVLGRCRRRRLLVGLLIRLLVLRPRLRRVSGGALRLRRAVHRSLLDRRCGGWLRRCVLWLGRCSRSRWRLLRLQSRRRLRRYVLRLRRRLRCRRRLRRSLRRRFLRSGRSDRGLHLAYRSRLRLCRGGGLGRGNAIVNKIRLGRSAFHAEFVVGGGMVSAVGTEHQDVNGG